jgi:putative transposase
MEEIMPAASADFECELVEFNGENNHVHPPVTFLPKVTPSKLVNTLEGVSSRRMRQELPDLVRHHYRANRLWSGSYFAGSLGGAPFTIPAAVHPATEPTRLDHARAWRPSRAGLHPALKGGALTRTLVADYPVSARRQRGANGGVLVTHP